MKAAKILIGIGILILLAAAIFIVNDLKDVSIEKFEITGIKDVTISSFTLDGSLQVSNPSIIPISLDGAEYQVVLKESGEVLSTGKLTNATLSPRSTTIIPFEHQTEWTPSINLLLDLVKQDAVLVTIEGTLYVDALMFSYPLKFSEEYDVKEYLMTLIPEESQGFVQDVLDFAQGFF